MDFWKSLSGMVTVEITSAEPEKALYSLAQKDISLHQVVKKNELTYQALIKRTDYKRLAAALKYHGASIQIVQKNGLYWKFGYLRNRPVLLLLCISLFVFSSCLPSRIVFVSVEGNKTLSDQMILSAAEQAGIQFGASRKQVRSEQVKNALLAELPQLQWAGVNTSGCTAVISVRERIGARTDEKSNWGSSLIAERDGHILATTVTSGTGQVAPGDTVKAGEILISGYTDCGNCIQVTKAEGEILALTNRQVITVMPVNYFYKEPSPQKAIELSLVLGKKRINLWKDSRISTAVYDRMYQEYYVSLPGGFQLPAAICIDRYTYCEVQEFPEEEHSAKGKLQLYTQDYMRRQMVAGEIAHKQEQFTSLDGLFKLESSYLCREIIGKEQREQIGVFNGKRS